MNGIRGDGNHDQGLARRLARLMSDAETIGAGRENRRETLIERAESHGLDRGDAELAYDLALEEGLEPAYALAVVGQGIAVRNFGGSVSVDVREAVEPEWIDRPPSARDATREQRLRATFRRLRAFLDVEGTPREAIARFASEPDLESYDY
ncbi:MAG TPA: hypothetical protein VMM83_07185 [Longimicrobiales bacterium]|nr:hypothetical protein [Longimicrobiales bacterium]